MNRPITFCADPSCRWPIYHGDEVWKAGILLYCHVECWVHSMKKAASTKATK